MKYLIRAAINAVGIWLCTLIVPGFSMVGTAETEKVVLYYLVAGAVFGLVNYLVRPIVFILALPLMVLTLGLFYFALSGLMLMLTASLTEGLAVHIVVDSLLAGVLGSAVLAVANIVLSGLLPEKYQS